MTLTHFRPTFLTVTLDHSDDSLFGGGDIPARYDGESDALFASTSAAIIAAFPGVDVVVKVGDFSAIDHDGDDPSIEGGIGQIIHEKWTDWLDKLAK